MEKFIRELEIGEIYQRDKWQFELKSEFLPDERRSSDHYVQEFYFFIPSSLQINEESYTKEQFYADQTNFIRYKTPELDLETLCEKERNSPLTLLEELAKRDPSPENMRLVEEQQKLLANIFRSSLRRRVGEILALAEKPPGIFRLEIEKLYQLLIAFRKRYLSLQEEFSKTWTSITEQSLFLYINEFLSETIDYYLTGLLHHILLKPILECEQARKRISDILLQERAYREQVLKKPDLSETDTLQNEYILYTRGLLNKFVLDALLLNTTRSSVFKRFRNLIGSLAAAVAMLFFFIVSQQSNLLINSMPFILLTVFLYVLKDRIKEELKNVSYTQFAKWFSDYKTDIFSADKKIHLGKLREYAAFINPENIPQEIVAIRDKEFHVVLEDFKRPEHVLYYKRDVQLHANGKKQALNLIFRFNIHKFLEKADDPIQEFITLDPHTLELRQKNVPKVYHLNVILKNTHLKGGKETMLSLKKFRLILDKEGIQRVEHVSH